MRGTPSLATPSNCPAVLSTGTKWVRRKLLPQLVQRDVHGVGYGGDLEVVHRPHVQQQVRPAFVEQPLVFSAADPGVLWERVQACRRLHYYRVRLKVFVRTED